MPKKRNHKANRKNIFIIGGFIVAILFLIIAFYAGQKTANNRSHAAESSSNPSSLPTVGKDHICMIKDENGRWVRVAICRGRLICSSTPYVADIGHNQYITVRLCKNPH